MEQIQTTAEEEDVAAMTQSYHEMQSNEGGHVVEDAVDAESMEIVDGKLVVIDGTN